MINPRCSFAPAGTYGHECGKPAVIIAVTKCDRTKSGLFYSGRCAKCAKIKGGENAPITHFEDIKDQVNDWKGCYEK